MVRQTHLVSVTFLGCVILLVPMWLNASTLDSIVVHETVTIADLLASQGAGATEIPSYGVHGDAGNAKITHTITGGYTANIVTVSGTIRADVTNGNWLQEALIEITTSDGDPFIVFPSGAGAATHIGQTDTFRSNQPIYGDPIPGGGQVFSAGPVVFEFFEDETFDEAIAAADNTFTDLTLEFSEATSTDGVFALGTLQSETPIVDDTHSHAPGGLDFITFTLPTSGTLDVLTAVSTNGAWGLSLIDTEIGLFDAAGALVAQHDDIDVESRNYFSAFESFILNAGDYTLVTTTFDSSLNDSLIQGDNISLVTAGPDFGDYALTILFTASGNAVCDFDQDGDCDPGDMDLLFAEIGAVGASPTFDLNGDQLVNEADIDSWLVEASDPANPFNSTSATFVRGDVDFDGDVDPTDLGILLNNFNDTTGLSYSAGNLNADQNVDPADLGLMLNNFGWASGAPASTVPEPRAGLWMWLAYVAYASSLRRDSRRESPTNEES